MTKASSSVIALESHDEKRFWRIHAKSRPPPEDGPRGIASGTPATAVPIAILAVSLISALHQRDARIIPVHRKADAQADDEKHQHDERDAFDRLAGLVERRIG